MAKRKQKPRIVSSPTNYPSHEKSPVNTTKTEYLPGLYDASDSRFAKEHYMTYAMAPSTSELANTSVRYYLSKRNKEEFSPRKRRDQKRYILDDYPDHKNLIEESIVAVLGPGTSSDSKTWVGKDFIAGLGHFLDYLTSEYADEEIVSIQDIDEQTLHQFYVYADQKPLKEREQETVYRYFLEISKATGKFKSRYRVNRNLSAGTPAYPTPVIYKMDYYARQSLKESIALYSIYSEAIEEAKEFGKLFTLENLLKTRYSAANSGSSRGSFLRNLDDIAKRKYGTNPKLWSQKRGEQYTYPDKEAKRRHMELIEMSKQGTDITPNTLSLKLCWFFEVYPDWPHSNKMNPEYDGIFHARLYTFANILNLDYNELSTRFRPAAEIIYPLFLLLQIRTGKNTQPLTDLSIEKDSDGKYALGLRLDDGGRKIFSIKSRTNSEDYIFLHADKEIDYYIETFLEWFGSTIYSRSEYKNFFQGFRLHSKKGEEVAFFTTKRREIASEKFLKKYKIFNHEANKQLNIVNHQRLRPSFVGAAYLRGLKEYETQHLLRHEQGSTQHLHYSNHVETKEHKLRRIAWAQRRIVDLFKGIIIKVGDKNLELGKGVLSDCADAKNPTHPQRPKLNDRQNCTDWMFCLLCEKSRVIKDLHGPVIIAMRLYLEELNENMLTREWEKEFSEISDSIESVLLQFTDEEKNEYSKKAHLHRALCEHAIYMKRKRENTREPEDEHEIA